MAGTPEDRDAITLLVGDCLAVLPGIADAGIDAIVTDPPYELGFMSRAWDGSGIANNVAMWRECWRILKPGGYLIAFGGTRTYHRMVCAVEDAGFVIRDSLHWIYGSGFPKSLDVSKAIDKAAGATRTEVIGRRWEANRKPGTKAAGIYGELPPDDGLFTAPATDDARRWQGWGTALKPAHEPIVLARKPFAGTVAATVLAHGTGALNIDGCRVATDEVIPGAPYRNDIRGGQFAAGHKPNRDMPAYSQHAAGRWPTNVILTHPPALDAAGDVTGDACADGCAPGCPVAEMDAQSGVTKSPAPYVRSVKADSEVYGVGAGVKPVGYLTSGHGDEGGASRYFPVFRYQAKAPRKERPRLADGTTHPTVKPVALMQWLVRLVTPPGGIICDPFAGSGTIGEAAIIESCRAVLIEQDAAYAELIKARLSKPIEQKGRGM